MIVQYRQHIPAKRFTPDMYYSSDIYGPCPEMAPIQIRTPLVDALQYNGKAIPGAEDLVWATAPYTVIKIYFTWPGYVGSETLVPIDLYAGPDCPTRGSIASQIAILFIRYMEKLKPFRLHPSVKRWRIGEGGLNARNVFFNHLVNTYKNIWQVDCDIII